MDHRIIRGTHAQLPPSVLPAGDVSSTNAKLNLHSSVVTGSGSRSKTSGAFCPNVLSHKLNKSGASGKPVDARKPPDVMPVAQFAALLIRKLEQLQVKQQHNLKAVGNSQIN